MRTFGFSADGTTGLLNGQPYYLRGSNVCYFRFEEDPLRGDKPWDEAWVRTLHQRFKSLHMNSLRYCIGFPPELWYRIADEEGILIQDEFPIWTLGEDAMTPVGVDTLADEYRDWIREHWNHASVLIWDAQNESRFDKTREALGRVRDLDLSRRPWDNGWGKPHRPTDIIEDHPYQYSRSMSQTDWNPELKPLPALDGIVDRYRAMGPDGQRPRIVNEYAWLWLQRDGEPTSLTRAGYERYLPGATPDQRREFYARRLAAMTEALRASRRVAGVLHFCGLGHSWPGCATSDHFLDLDTLEFEPHFQKYVPHAFAPIGLMLSAPDTAPTGSTLQMSVTVFNDLGDPWQGDVVLFKEPARTATPVTKTAKVNPYKAAELTFAVTMPDQPGRVEWEANLAGANGQMVRSRRLIEVQRSKDATPLPRRRIPEPPASAK
jgi:beta-galactosidase